MTATKYLDSTGLQYFKTKLDALFRTETQVDSQIDSKLATYQQNVIQIVSSEPVVSNAEEGILYLVVDTNDDSGTVYKAYALENVGSTPTIVQVGSGTFTPVDPDQTVIDGSTNPVAGGAVYDELELKVNTSDIATSVTNGDTNPVSGGAVYTELAQKVSTSDVSTTVVDGDTNPVSGDAVYDELALKVDISSVATTVSSGDTNPVSGDAVYDALALKVSTSDVSTTVTDGDTNPVSGDAVHSAIETAMADIDQITETEIDAMF